MRIEGISINKNWAILSLLMALLITANLSFGQEESNATLTTNVTNFNNTSVPDLKYIWSVTGIESDQIIMALNQNGTDLFGRVKYEAEKGEPWNGEVAGWVSGDHVYLAISALKGYKQILSILDGILAEPAIRGKFFQTSEDEILDHGEFNAIWISPDLSSYMPAKMPTTTTNLTGTSEINQTVQQIVPQKSRFHDVSQDPLRFILI